MFDFIVSLFESFILLKIGFLILNFFLIVFLLVLFKQQNAMGRVIYDNGGSALINTIAIISIFIACSLFAAALVIL